MRHHAGVLMETLQPRNRVLRSDAHHLHTVQVRSKQNSSVPQDGKVEHAVRIAGNAGSEEWRFWVDLMAGGALHIEVAVTYWERSTPALDKLIAERMPAWVTLLLGVSMHSDWTF